MKAHTLQFTLPRTHPVTPSTHHAFTPSRTHLLTSGLGLLLVISVVCRAAGKVPAAKAADPAWYWRQAARLEAARKYKDATVVWLRAASDASLPLANRKEAYQHADFLKAFFTVPLAPTDDTYRAYIPIAEAITASKQPEALGSAAYPASEVRMVSLWVSARNAQHKKDRVRCWDLLMKVDREHARALYHNRRWKLIAQDVTDVRSALADAVFKDKDFQHASQWYRFLLQRNPGDHGKALWQVRLNQTEREPTALLKQVESLRLKKKNAEAMKLCQDLVARFPWSASAPEGQFLLGVSLAQTGDYPHAVEALGKVSQNYPDSAFAMLAMLRAASYYRGPLSDLEMALKLYETILTRYPTNPDSDQAYFAVGAIYQEVGEKDKAIQAWRRLIQTFPKSPLAAKAKEKMKG